MTSTSSLSSSTLPPNKGVLPLSVRRASSAHVRGSYLTTDIIVARRYTTEARFRDLAGPDRKSRAAWLVVANVCSIRVAAAAVSSKVVKISFPSVERAVAAIKAGRSVGFNGRPAHLSEQVQQKLLGWIQEQSNAAAAPTFEEVMDKVGYSLLLSFFYSFLLIFLRDPKLIQALPFSRHLSFEDWKMMTPSRWKTSNVGQSRTF